MNNHNVAAVHSAYAVAERKDLEGWINVFTPDGAFTDNSVSAAYRGRALADMVGNYGTAFSIKRLDCYPEGSIIFPQLGILNNLDAPCVTENSKAAS